MSGVQVAVRVRPFNSRETKMNSKCVISMDGPATTITNPEDGTVKTFAFDFSYWSHSDFKEDEKGFLVKTSAKYADQRDVFNDLGQNVLNNAFEGFNCSLFAYGQTGSGKSFSMVGYGVNKGIIPITCDELFRRVESNTDASKSYEVYVSMLEIYNEAIHDLFQPGKKKHGGLKVREKKGIGVYVDGLSKIPVSSYVEVEKRMEEGTANRTVAATQMNATSSRAHTVFTLTFKQIQVDAANPTVKSAKESNINLVDLAGSERAESTGATGDRLKEGCAINQSLSALGNVISALADKAGGKKGVFIPYRSSKLTRLLQDALGGNSKTIMIAALSPADVNYDETLSTLKYADRAKKIKNNAVVNENPTDKMIRQLKEENQRLLKLLEGKGIDLNAAAPGAGSGVATADLKAMEEAHARELAKTIQENNAMMEEMQKTWQQKLAEAKDAKASAAGLGVDTRSSAEASRTPHLLNLHEDPQLSECVVYMFRQGTTKIGRDTTVTGQNIVLNGLNVKMEHCDVDNVAGTITVRPNTALNAKVFVNGELVGAERVLANGDRVIIGNNFVFRFLDPVAPELGVEQQLDWSEAMEELAQKQGFRTQEGVDNQVSKLEEEERRLLEEKIKEMEARIEKERDEAKRKLAEQRRLFLEQGGDVNSADMEALEEQMRKSEEEREHEVAQQRVLTQKIVQDQMKRKRQTRKIEEELSKLMPMVKEANSMAEELGKSVRFEAKLHVQSPKVIDLDELRHLKTISTVVKMNDSVTQNVWTWTYAKFENRLFMMRDLYESGRADVALADDPFWDPPEPIEIGKAYVYLKALTYLVEIEDDFAIVNYKGETDGTLRVEIVPFGPDHEELDYLQNGAEELVGRKVGWAMKLPGASGISPQISHNIFASFTFLGQTLDTEPCPQQSTNPVFNFETEFPSAEVTADVCKYLETEPIVVEVKGFREAQVDLKPSTLLAPGLEDTSALCTHCEDENAFFSCAECSQRLCVGCDSLLHMSAAKQQTHRRQPIVAAVDASNNAAVDASNNAAVDTSNNAAVDVAVDMGPPLCSECEEFGSTISCIDCNISLCVECDDFLHLSPAKKTHRRVPLASSGVGSELCVFCEEHDVAFACVQCKKRLCRECDEFLHLSPMKSSHERAPLSANIL